MSDERKKWIESCEHLPKWMRDFHDQKDLFKAIDSISGPANEMSIPWTKAHVYVLDNFLTVMAQCGYTLQRSRKKFEFGDVVKWVRQCREKRNAAFADALKTRLAAGPGTPDPK